MDKVIIKKEELENTPNYVLYIKMLEQVDGTLGDIKDEISKRHPFGSYFKEMNTTLDNLARQTFELNKTMNNIAESLRVISHNNR